MRIVAAGATGFLGTPLVHRLKHAGHTVTVVSRSPDKARESLGVDAVGWDGGALEKAVESADAVINLAGEGVAEKRWSPEFKARIRSSRIEPTARLASLHPKILVQASAVGLYGDGGESALSELSPAATDFFGEVCAAWEAAAQPAEATGRVVYLRLGQVLGRGGGALESILHPPMVPVSPWSLGLGGPLGSGKQWMPWVHINDVLDAFVWALETPSARGAYNVAAPGIVRAAEFAHALGTALGKPSAVPVPTFALKLLVGEFAEYLVASQKIVPARLLEEDFLFQFPELAPALGDLLQTP